MKLGAWTFLRFFYWALRRNRAAARHMLAVPPGCIVSAVRLGRRLRRSADRRPTVAIALLEHMGDIVAAEPIARLARRRFPGARICWITRAQYAALAGSFPDIEVVVVGCLTEWMLLQRLGMFDVVWDLHVSGRHCPLCGIPQLKPGMRPDQLTYYNHGSLLDVQCLSAGLPRLDGGPILATSPAAVAAVDALALPPRYVVIHCVSSDPRRDWPADKWRRLIGRIIAAMPAAAVEVGMRPLVIEHDGPRQRTLCGALTILETAEVIRRAELFVGIDSGPAHLANAVATPGVILLGAYLGFRAYTPYSGGYATGRTADLVRADGPVRNLAVDTVYAAVMARLIACQDPAAATWG